MLHPSSGRFFAQIFADVGRRKPKSREQFFRGGEVSFPVFSPGRYSDPQIDGNGVQYIFSEDLLFYLLYLGVYIGTSEDIRWY